MSLRASTTTTLDAFRPIAPPADPSTAFLSDRDLASKIGKSTQASTQSMDTPPGVGTAELMGYISYTQYGTRERNWRRATNARTRPTAVQPRTIHQ